MAIEKEGMTIRKSIQVERSPEISFKVFCEEIGAWWQEALPAKTRAWRWNRGSAAVSSRSVPTEPSTKSAVLPLHAHLATGD